MDNFDLECELSEEKLRYDLNDIQKYNDDDSCLDYGNQQTEVISGKGLLSIHFLNRDRIIEDLYFELDVDDCDDNVCENILNLECRVGRDLNNMMSIEYNLLLCSLLDKPSKFVFDDCAKKKFVFYSANFEIIKKSFNTHKPVFIHEGIPLFLFPWSTLSISVNHKFNELRCIIKYRKLLNYLQLGINDFYQMRILIPFLDTHVTPNINLINNQSKSFGAHSNTKLMILKFSRANEPSDVSNIDLIKLNLGGNELIFNVLLDDAIKLTLFNKTYYFLPLVASHNIKNLCNYLLETNIIKSESSRWLRNNYLEVSGLDNYENTNVNVVDVSVGQCCCRFGYICKR